MDKDTISRKATIEAILKLNPERTARQLGFHGAADSINENPFLVNAIISMARDVVVAMPSTSDKKEICVECCGKGRVSTNCPNHEDYAKRGLSCSVMHEKTCPVCKGACYV